MHNPFEEIVKPRVDFAGGGIEEVEGTFFCDLPGCYGVAKEAVYIVSEQTLSWECPEGHLSHIEDYTL